MKCYILKIGGGGEPHALAPVCVDCGAHAGLISDIILHCGGEVHSFEPNIYLNFFLNKKYENHKLAHLYQKALSHTSGKTKFLCFQNRILSQGNRIVSSVQDDETSSSYEVELIDLCEFIEKLLLKHEQIYFLKLDIEGAEFEIMDKLIDKKLYEKIKYIACETHEYMFENGDAKLANLKKQIVDKNIKNIFLDWI